MNSKKIVKKLLRPFFGPIIRVAHLKIFGKHVFINKYSRKLPIVDRTVLKIQNLMLVAQTAHERDIDYKKWFRKNYPNQTIINQQKKLQKSFKKTPLISLIVPTHNTNPSFLRDCIRSVISQSYSNWELCIADDASTNPSTRAIIIEFAEKDKRIKYVFRETNGHICKASNSALELAEGEYIGLLDHDDVLWPNALFEVVKLINDRPKAEFIYSDEDKIDEGGKKHSEPFFKPNWSFEYLRSVNYITHFSVLKRQLVKKVGGFRPGYEGAQDWDLFLRASRATQNIYHIPTVLYSWRKSENSTAQRPSAKDYAYTNQKKALEDDVASRGLKANIGWEIPFSMWRIDYKLSIKPLISIIIPTKDQYDIVKLCLDSIRDKTTYKNYELVIVDTDSADQRVWSLYAEYKKNWKHIKVVNWIKPFNFSSACDFGAKNASGEYLIFLNNDTEVISPNWIEDMLGYASQKEVGAVGCKLYYPNGKLQHAGIILGVGGQNGTPGIAGHFFPAFIDNPPQDPAQQLYIGGTRNFAAVTAACVMVAKEKFNRVKGFDPKFKIAFNDVDFCLKLLESGLRNVYLPHVKLFHHESISIGLLGSKQRDSKVFSEEINLMLKKWGKLINNDPYYHPDFRRDIASARLSIK